MTKGVWWGLGSGWEDMGAIFIGFQDRGGEKGASELMQLEVWLTPRGSLGLGHAGCGMCMRQPAEW